MYRTLEAFALRLKAGYEKYGRLIKLTTAKIK